MTSRIICFLITFLCHDFLERLAFHFHKLVNLLSFRKNNTSLPISLKYSNNLKNSQKIVSCLLKRQHTFKAPELFRICKFALFCKFNICKHNLYLYRGTTNTNAATITAQSGKSTNPKSWSQSYQTFFLRKTKIFSVFWYQAWPLYITVNIFLCYKHSSLTTKIENKEKQSLVGLIPGMNLFFDMAIFFSLYEEN